MKELYITAIPSTLGGSKNKHHFLGCFSFNHSAQKPQNTQEVTLATVFCLPEIWLLILLFMFLLHTSAFLLYIGFFLFSLKSHPCCSSITVFTFLIMRLSYLLAVCQIAVLGLYLNLNRFGVLYCNRTSLSVEQSQGIVKRAAWSSCRFSHCLCLLF